MSIFYIIGSLNGDFEAFRRIWVPVTEYLDEGPASILVSGNFGLANQRFLEKVDKENKGKIPVHICGGNAAQEGWKKTPPPEKGAVEIGKNIFLHAFGSGANIEGFPVLFLGRGDALAHDFYPVPCGCDYVHTPKDSEVICAKKFVEKKRPKIIVSHALPGRVCESLCKGIPSQDIRKKRLSDPIIKYLDVIDRQATDCYWFGSSLGMPGKRTDSKRGMSYVSLMSFSSSQYFSASVETFVPDRDYPENIEIGNLIY